jgi:hypothetical protein
VADPLEDELGRLYGLPLEEFTGARNDLARRLKREGDPRAVEVGRLAKPTVALWAVNQLARRERQATRRLLRAGAALRKAQERALGGGSPGALLKAQQEERDAVRALRERAHGLLAEAGRAATEATLDRVTATLSAAAVDDGAGPSLEAGRLAAEVQPAGFEALAGMRVARRPAPPQRPSAAAERRQKLRAQLREVEREARDAERAADRADAEAAARRREADTARAKADALAARLERV